MNENIDLTVILKNCPKGTKLYTTVWGEVTFIGIKQYDDYPILIETLDYSNKLTKKGCYIDNKDTECLLFPSKEQRDWSKFSAPWYKKEESIKPRFKVGDRIRHKETNKGDVYEISEVYDDYYGITGAIWMISMEHQDQYELVPNKFDPKTLKPFDKVIVNHYEVWKVDFFSHVCQYEPNGWCQCIGDIYWFCIPYNDDTKNLVGTKNEVPEYYRYWED